MKLTNNHNRTIGVPGQNGSIIIEPNNSADITEADLKTIKSSNAASIWLKDGLISVDSETATDDSGEDDGEEESDQDAPETATVKHVGGGRWNAFVNGEPLSEETLDKEEAEALAVEYNAPSN